MATKAENISSPESCWSRAEEDEPVFVLRAHDPLAPDVVRRWAFARSLDRGFHDVAAQEARKVAEAMEAWRVQHR